MNIQFKFLFKEVVGVVGECVLILCFVVLFGLMNQLVSDLCGLCIWLVGVFSGIGVELVCQVLQVGVCVVLLVCCVDVLQEVVVVYKNVFIVLLDVFCYDVWCDQYVCIVEVFGGVDLLVFCVVKYCLECIWEVQEEEVEYILCINVVSVYLVLGVVLFDMLVCGSGGIVLVVSVVGYVGLLGVIVYGFGKVVLINFVEIFYSDLWFKGLNVYLVNLGFVKIDLIDKNDFFMLVIQMLQQVVIVIWCGIFEGCFEIYFLWCFMVWLKILCLLLFWLCFMLFQCFMLS